MPSEPTTMRMSAWLMRSELTTGPIVVRLACASMGPWASSRAVTIAPRSPPVGSCVFPTGAADGDGPGDAEAPGDADAEGAGEPDGAGDADADGAGEPDGVAEPDADGATEAAGAADADGASLPDGAPLGASDGAGLAVD